MNLHIKIKHNGGNKTNREQSARELVFLKSLGKKINLLEVTKGFNLPPGIVYTAVKQLRELEQEVTISDAELEQLEAMLRAMNQQQAQSFKKKQLLGKPARPALEPLTCQVVNAPVQPKEEQPTALKLTHRHSTNILQKRRSGPGGIENGGVVRKVNRVLDYAD